MKKCNQCGACCVAIPIPQTKKELTNENSATFIKKHWKRISKKEGHKRLNAYLKKKLGKRLGTFKEYNVALETRKVYICDWFNEKTGKCKHYDKRPKVCRDYPYYGKPKNTNVNGILIGTICGYHTK